MSPTKRKKKATKLWHYTAGEHGAKVTVEEREPGGILYVRMWDPAGGKGGEGAQVRRSLGHRDQVRAKAYAHAAAEKLALGTRLTAQVPTLRTVLQLYLTHRTPAKGAEQQQEDIRRAGMWLRVLGGGSVKVSEAEGVRTVAVTGGARDLRTLGATEWETFKRQRASGEINADGEYVPAGVDKEGRPLRRPVGARTVDADLVFLNAVMNWATDRNQLDGTTLLDRNPWGAATPGRKRKLERPKNPAPKRPVATHDRYLAVRKAATKVMMKRRGRGNGAVPSYLPEILDLVEQTGRRRDQVLYLWCSDPVWGLVEEPSGEKRRGVVAIRWRPFKGAEETIVQVSPETRELLERILRSRRTVGDVPMFPRMTDPSKSITEKTADEWLLKAERLAPGVRHLEGGLWHPYRRKFATERKHIADVDVAAVGGWKDIATMKKSYQQVDAATTQEVLTNPRRLREKKA